MIRENGPLTLTATLAAFFAAHPGEWIDGRRLATIAGAYAWRTRLSQCRRAPWHMTIENRIRRIHLYWDPEWNGRRIQVSEYRYVPADAVDSALALGIDWMQKPELMQAIPPAYTEYIGRQLIDHIRAERVA